MATTLYNISGDTCRVNDPDELAGKIKKMEFCGSISVDLNGDTLSVSCAAGSQEPFVVRDLGRRDVTDRFFEIVSEHVVGDDSLIISWHQSSGHGPFESHKTVVTQESIEETHVSS